MNQSSLFRQLFLSYGLIFLVVIGFLFGITSFELSKYLKNRAYEEIHFASLAKRNALEAKLNQSLINLKSWASLVVMNDFITNDIDLRITRTLENFKTLHHLQGHLYALSPTGKLIAADIKTPIQINFNLYLPAIKKEQHLIDKHTDPVTHKPIIALWQRVYASFDPKLPIGYLVMTYPWKVITSSLDLPTLNTNILLFDQNNKLLNKGQIAPQLIEDILKIVFRISTNVQKKSTPELTFENKSYFVVDLDNSLNFPQTRLWYWVSITDSKQFYAPAQRVLKMSALLAGVIMLFGLFVIFLLSRRISHPIQRLTRTAVDISSTLDLSKRASVTGNNEIFQMGTAFNSMCSNLEKSWKAKKKITQELRSINQLLEQKVLDRTEHLAWQATHDPLTGLPNRALLSERLEQAIVRAQRSQQMLAILFIDLDGFKSINDNYGHASGDYLLVELASRFLSFIREPDTISRLGGDEFVILMHLEKLENLNAPLERCVKLINQPFITETAQLNVSPSIGVTIFPNDPSDSDTLIRHADQAMYQAKQKGRNQVHFFNIQMDNQIHAELAQRKEVNVALQNEQFVLYYQPQVDLQSNTVVGAEALIRWNHPDKGLVFPDDFLPVIENTDLMIDLGRWVIQHACQQLHNWNSQGLILKLSVNIGCCHIQHADFFNELVQFLAAYPDVKPEQLVLEITESAAIHDFDTAKNILQSCHNYNVRIALDDFGTGFSSLTYLRQLPISFIKIDKSFVIDMLHDSDDMVIVKGTIALAKSFKQAIVAEGVETQKHYDALKNMGCTIGQGYGIAKPLSTDKFILWVESHHDLQKAASGITK